MGEFTEQLLQVFARTAVPDQSVISGLNPVAYNASDPAPLWIIQVIIIMAMTQLLSLILSRIRQPRVIAEVIAGVILGPTVMGRIPGFTQAIFPQAGMPVLRLTSTIGLVFFLFIVGLEIDTRVMKNNMVASASVSIAGLIVPLGLGAALGVGVYREFINPSVNFGIFLLFTAVAVGITAFPVLCRILTSLELLDTEVGLVTLAAGIGNDVIGWVLLALTVALVNASTGLTALWVLLASAGYTIFLLFPVRWGYRWLAKRTGSIERGTPSTLMMTITLFIVLISALFTDIIGVHPIFGGFLAGLLIPHDNGYSISIVEKLEDLVTIILLPLYFALSGLNTNLGLLNTGICWAYIVIICLVAFTSKFVACGGVALCNGYSWREAGAIGSLMSCKGLVELIVLNIGFQANILDSRTFSMFVVHALILTFMTTPLVLLFYPAKYRTHRQGNRKNSGDETATGVKRLSDGDTKTKFAIILDKIEALPAAMTLSQLLSSPFTSSPLSSGRTSVIEKPIDAKANSSDSDHTIIPPVTVGLLRLIELTDRTSAVLRSQEAASSFVYNDPVISVYRTFGQLNCLDVTANVSVVTQDQFPDTVAKHASETGSQMTIIPWPRGVTSIDEEHQIAGVRNPFDGVFHKTTTVDQTNSVIFSEFIRNVFAKSPSDVALFVDRGLNVGYVANNQHLFLPFFGGPDDRLALNFLGQLCKNPSVTATVVRLVSKGRGTPEDAHVESASRTNAVFIPTSPDASAAAADTVYGQSNTQMRLESDTADNLTWEQFTKPTTPNSRITFLTETTLTPLGRSIELIKAEATLRSSSSNNKTMIVLAGRSRRMAVESLHGELSGLINNSGSSISASVSKTLGDVGAALVLTNVNASLLILQAAPPNHDD